MVKREQRSLFLLIFSIAIYVRDAGVAGSNPATPTKSFSGVLPAFPDTCKAAQPPVSIRNPLPRPSSPRKALHGDAKKKPGMFPPGTSVVQTCVYDPAAQSVRAVAWRSAQEGVGNAGCPRTRSRVRKVESTRVSHHGYAGAPGIPARNGFNGFLRTLVSAKSARMCERAVLAKPPVAGTEPVTPQRRQSL